MRAIVNIMPGRAAAAAGWRAREVTVDRLTASIGDILRSVHLANGSTENGDATKDGPRSVFDLVAVDHSLKPDFAVFISGVLVRGAVDWDRPVADSEQIHLCDWPMSDS